MHTFIIIGHPESGYQEIEKLLLECGMKRPKPSRREGLSPSEIDKVLCQAYSRPAPSNLTSENEVKQIEAAPIWHGMALDLMLANVDQDFWGWADPHAFHLLEYWKSLDPSIKFIFIYNDLTTALKNTPKDASPSTYIANWQIFNASILHFHYRNLDRSVLIHASQAIYSKATFLDLLKTKLDAPVIVQKDKRTTELQTTPLTESISNTWEAGSLEDLVSGLLIKQHPQVDQLYQELQSSSNLPLSTKETEEISTQLAWNDLIQLRQHLDQQKQRLAEAESINRVNLGLRKENRTLQEENELILLQLHQLQEELKSYNGTPPPSSTKYYGAADRVKHQLSYRLGATMIKQSKSFIGIITMLFALVQTVRIFRREHRKLLSQNLPPISHYADAKQAEQVKQHLSYRLGQAILKNAKSPLGWLRMPFTIRRVIKDFRLNTHK